MGFRTRLKELRIEKKLNQRELAEKLMIAPSTISMYENGNREPNFEILEQLADFFNVDLNYLLGKTDKTTKLIFDTENQNQGIKVPVLGAVPAGIPITAIEDIIDYEEIPQSWSNQGDFFGLRIKGNSMYPKLENGDVVIVKKQSTADNGDVVIAMVNGDDATCKRYKRMDAGIMLTSDNSEYSPMFYTNEQIQSLPVNIIGKVVESRKKF